MESSHEQLNQIKSKVNFGNVKSVYILMKIFKYAKKKKYLEIMKYNKKLQTRLKIGINDYIDYFQTYSSIEIELKLIDKKYDFYSNLIHIPEKNKEYYHIYFDNSRKETTKTKLNKYDKVKVVKIIIDYQVKSFNNLFYGCKCIGAINFKKFFRTNVTNMNNMFSYCESLKELNLSNFNTNNVTNMSYMFYRCSSLKELNLSNFNTNNVTDMRYMFNGCPSLNELNLSNFNTNNVRDMRGMFYGCLSLKELNLSNFNTNNVTNMSSIFYECSSLKE